VGGCLPVTASARLKEVFKGRFFSTKDLSNIDELFSDFKIRFSNVADVNQAQLTLCEQPDLLLPNNESIRRKLEYKLCGLLYRIKKTFTMRRHAYLRISSGCLGNCSYCAIRKAVGTLRSKSLQDCLAEYKNLLYSGYRDITLFGDDTGAYGSDINSSFTELLDKMSEADKGLKVKLFILNINPHWAIKFKEALIKLIIEGKIASLICPIQSGSERILKLMNRYSNIKEIEEALIEFKQANPKLSLESHIIVGFPTETEEDFNKSLDVIRRVNFDSLAPFVYGEREGTPSSRMEGRLNEETIKRRTRVIYELLKELGIRAG